MAGSKKQRGKSKNKIKPRKTSIKKVVAKKPRSSKTTKKNRFVPIRGDKARRFKDIKTGRTISRRQAEKFRTRTPRPNRAKVVGTFHRTVAIRRDYIAKRTQRGVKLSVRDAVASPTYQKILADLKRGAQLRAQGKEAEAQVYLLRALKKTTRRDGIKDTIPVGESPKAGDSES